MKYWLVVLVSFGSGLMSGIPAFAGSAMHRQGLAESFGGFAGNSPVRVGVPTMRQPAAPGAPVSPHGVSPAARTAVTPVVSEVGTRDEMTPATRSAGIRPVEPRMIVIDPSGGARTLASTGSATAAPPVVRSATPKVLVISKPIAPRSTGPRIIEVNPATVFKPLRPKVIVVSPSLVSRHRGRTVIGIAEGPQGTTLLLGSSCDLGVGLAESCAPVDSAPLIVEAAPDDAQVFLDGQFLGTAGHLAGETVVVPAGPHALQIMSPQAEPFSAQFTATPGIPTRIHVALAAQ
jgi:hypothetical protein